MPKKKRGGVGFCWKANALSPNAKLRSISPDLLEEYRSKNINQSLQMKGNDECPNWMTPFPDDVKDLYDTAEIMSSLAVITTVDTGLCHLAGAMNMPTTLLINKHHDWRFKLLSEDGYSLFYPSVEVIQL